MTIKFDKSRQPIAQGDMYLIPIVSIPHGAERVSSESGMLILTHSETGHHHVVLERPGVEQFKDAMDVFRGFLSVDGEAVELTHLREHHKHAPQVVSPGAWLIQRQAAYTPQGWERARD